MTAVSKQDSKTLTDFVREMAESVQKNKKTDSIK
jgi:hypothetical protein